MATKATNIWDLLENEKKNTQKKATDVREYFTTEDDRNAFYKAFQERLDNWSKERNDLFSQANDYYTNRDLSTYGLDSSNSWKDTVSSKYDWLKSEADYLNSLLDEYGYLFDDDAKSSLRNSFTETYKSSSDLLRQADSDIDYWNQFKDENQYLDYYYGSKYSDMSYSDVMKARESATGKEKDWLMQNYMTSAEAQAEIDRLEATLPSYFEGWFDKIAGKDDEHKETRDRIAQLKGIRDTAERTEKVESYEPYRSDSRFAEASSNGASITNPTVEEINEYEYLLEKAYSSIDRTSPDGGMVAEAEVARLEQNPVKVQNKVHFYLDNPELRGYPVHAGATDEDWESIMHRGLQYNWDELTEDEIQMYDYLLAEKGEEVADQYLEDIQVVLDQRATEAMNAHVQSQIENTSGFKGFLVNTGLSLASIPTNVFGGALAFVDNTINQHFKGGESINPYSPAQSFRNFSTTVRGEVGAEIADKATWELFGQNVMQNVYNAGLSMGDSLLGAVTMNKAYSLVAGSGAAASHAADLYEKGASNEQIFWGGITAGVAEAVFEKYSIEKLLSKKIVESPLQFVTEVLKQAGVEGSEEVFTEIANIISDSIVMGSKSDLSLAIKMYEDGYFDENGIHHEPLSHADAVKKALTDKVCEVAWAGISGMLSGGGSSFIWTGAQYLQQANAQTDLGRDIIKKNGYDALKGLATDASSVGLVKGEANIKNLAQKTQTGVDAIKEGNASKRQANKTFRQVGRLSQNVDSVRNEQNIAEIQASLESKGLSKSKARKAALLLNEALYSDGAYSKELYKSVMNDEGVWDTLRELVSSPDSSLKNRNLQHKLGRMGLKVGENGTIVSSVKAGEAESHYVDESLSFIEDASKREYEASVDGKSIDTTTGKTIDIVEVASIKNGKMMLKVKGADGVESVVNAKDVSYASESEALVYEAVANMGLNAVSANSILKLYNPSQNASTFARGVQEAYRYGLYNYSEFEMYQEGNFLLDLTDAQVERAYKLGQIQSGSDTAVAVAKLKEAIANSKGKKGEGRVHFEGDAVGIDVDSLKDQQKVSIKTMEMLSKALGIEFYVYASYENENGDRVYKDEDGVVKPAPNGIYDKATGAIHIDLNAGETGEGTMLFTIAHELTHFIKAWSPAKFKVLANFLVEQYGKKGMSVEQLVRRQMANMKANGRKNVTYDKAFEEFVADSMETMLTSGNVVETLAEIKRVDEGLWNKIKEFFSNLVEHLKEVVSTYSEFAPNTIEGQTVAEMTDVIEQLEKLFTEALVDASENFRAISYTEQQTLAEVGIGFDEDTRSVHSLRFSTGRKDALGNVIDLVKVGKKEFNTESIAQLVAKGTGRSIEDARKWVNSEIAIANIVMNHPEFLDFQADDRYDAIKKNSDYPQGTVDLSNLCPKRTEFTAMFDMLQKKYPNKLFTASDVAAMRSILKKRGITVACGACFVEDRRQLLGEIADTYIGMWKEAVETGKPLQKTNASGNKVTLTVTSALAKQYGLTKGSEILATDKYIPTQYDLTTYEGFKLLEKNHPTIAMGFNRYNNSRGQQAGRLIEGRAEYNRQILGWSPAKVKSVNNNGGLRIFSFSDFEVVHLLDLVQVILDCSAMGVKIQGYTKIPSFARLIRDTGIKINRSLIPKGQTGLKKVNGKWVLDYDTTEGIDINDENFIDERDNPNVGNILIGINPTQIGIAMLDDFVDYIIPFHTNKSKDICKALGLAEWVNYKESQHEKDIDTGKASKHNVNIYTEVMGKYHPTNKVEFVNAFLKVCKAQKKIPRYSEFLNKEYKADGAYTDEYGSFDFTYREGYHKLLVDFKMFDRNGNILPQGEITPNLDDAFMAELLKGEVDKKQNYEFPQEVYEQLDKEFGEEDSLYSERNKITLGMTDTERARILEQKKVVAPIYKGQAEALIKANKESLESQKKGLIKAALVRIGEEFGIFTDYDIGDIGVEITLSKGNIKESVSKDASPIQLARLIPVLKDAVENAIGIESHSNRYFYDNTTVLFENMLGGYVDGKYFVPIRFGLKHSEAGKATLYVIVSQQKIEREKIKAEIVKTSRSQNVKANISPSAYAGSIPQIIPFVNSKDLLRYLPDDMLTEEQKQTKLEGIAETIKATNDKNDKKYKEFIESGNLRAAQAMVVASAKAHGYTIAAHHGSRHIFREFSREKRGANTRTEISKRWFFAADKDTANSYYPYGTLKEIQKQHPEWKWADPEKLKEKGKLYDLFLKFDNPLVVDVSEYDYASHRERADSWMEFVQQAEENGNDGIILLNAMDNQLKTSARESTVYMFRESSQAKSADTITYDENDEVIPLSKRFDSEEDDFYYSDRTAPKAIEHFGTTSNFEQAGFVVADGRMLKLSKYGLNGVNHSRIAEVYDDAKGSDAVNRFIQEGNVRIKTESPGVEIGETAITTSQLNTISRHIGNSLRSKGYFYLDITGKNGDTIASVEYDEDSSAEDIIYDIKAYYERGRVPSQKSWYYYSDRKVVDIPNNKYVDMYHHFGSTKNYDVAGYMLGNGVMLDFSGKHWGDDYSTSRQVDHRDIQEVLDDRGNNGVNAMIDMIGNGNIRLMPEVGGINLAVKPNESQMSQLRGYINHFKGEVVIDIDKVGGDTIHSFTYTRGTSSSKILSDLKAYFDEGVVPQQKASGETDVRDFLYSDRNKTSVSNRTLLANALESAVTNEFEKKTLAEYKEELGRADALEKELAEIRAKKRELYFAKGHKDTEALKKLQEQETKTVARIDVRDKKLLRLEATKPLKDIIHREREKARKRAEKEGKEALAKYREKTAETQREMLSRWKESRHQAVEGRSKTAMRHKIKSVVAELNKLLLHGTKDKHVMIGLQKAVASALDAVNMDTVGAEERVAKYNALIAKEKNPDIIESLTATRDRILSQGENIREKLDNLKNAYSEIKNSDDPLIANSYDEVIFSKIESVVASVGNTALRDMSLSQLEDVYDLYKMVLTTIRNSNKAFKAKKGEEISVLANRVMEEVEVAGGKKQYSLKALEGLKKYGWSILKPVYAFKLIGSKTFSDVFSNVREGEDTWAIDVSEATAFRADTAQKYNYKSWDFKKKFTFTSKAGVSFNLTLDQMLSLYAYSKRKQADDHLEKGGFVFDSAIEVEKKSKLGIPLKYIVNTATAHNLSKETLAEIIGNLTAEQKGFVDEMQEYLSTVMGEKGNEVSLAMYGVKLFKEKFYFPLKSAKQFMFEQNEVAGEVKIKNAGFSKETVAFANNPIILSNFMDVWANHVNDMAMYHSFVLPLEDFNRVYNYKTPTTDNMQTEGVKQYLQNAYGTQATSYVSQLLKDLNGGARSDPQAGFINASISKFKKASVFASMSVVIQQPSAIGRAFAYVDPKYFVGEKVNKQKQKEAWEEAKKYAPVAIIKEMGYFDVGNGRSTVDYIKGDKTIWDRVDDVASRMPAKADEITWSAIWEAVKRETADRNKALEVNSEEFLKAVGERFSEVIVNTQVYDSVLSRSGIMRSKDTGAKMATAFMAEPTTTINMEIEALLRSRKGDKKGARRLQGGVIASIVINAILVSFVYAGRDDDEDETYAEKYLGSLTSELIDGFNPLTYLPFVKDIWSIAQGYDVERSDMTIVSSLWKSFEALFSENTSAYDKVKNFTGTVANLFGLPVKNVWRDVEALFNVASGIIKGTPTTFAGIGYSMMDAVRKSIPLWDKFDSAPTNADKLYNAIISGDPKQIARAKGEFKDEDAINTAIRKALRENDSRINEAAKARMSGDIEEYTRIVREIVSEGHFSQDLIVGAVNNAITALKKGEEASNPAPEEDDEYVTITSIYNGDDLNYALDSGDTDTATAIIDDLLRVKTENYLAKARKEAEKDGKSFNERTALKEAESKAKSSVKSSITSYWKPLYKEAYKKGDTEEMKRIRYMLRDTKLYGSTSDVLDTVKGWLKS